MIANRLERLERINLLVKKLNENEENNKRLRIEMEMLCDSLRSDYGRHEKKRV